MRKHANLLFFAQKNIFLMHFSSQRVQQYVNVLRYSKTSKKLSDYAVTSYVLEKNRFKLLHNLKALIIQVERRRRLVIYGMLAAVNHITWSIVVQPIPYHHPQMSCSRYWFFLCFIGFDSSNQIKLLLLGFLSPESCGSIFRGDILPPLSTFEECKSFTTGQLWSCILLLLKISV